MGFIKNNNNDEISIIAKLTTYGRQRLLAGDGIIKYFSVGDSDANYYTSLPLENGDIPAISGDINNNLSMLNNYKIKNKVIVNDIGNTKKMVEGTSNNININKNILPTTVINNTKVEDILINRDDFNTDKNVNLLYSLGLPITEADKTIFNTVNYDKGGYANTALNKINSDSTLLLAIDNDEYGEIIDGKSLEIIISRDSDSVNPFKIYGTFQKNLTPLNAHDKMVSEDTNNSRVFGDNVIFLFSDQIKKPNEDATKSWSNGHDKIKPYSINKRNLFNLVGNDINNIKMDECVGIAYLDKGIIAITHPTIIDDYSITGIPTTNVEVTLSSISTNVSQDIICIINRDEFNQSSNKTFNGDDVRISEIGIYDYKENLVAIAKTSEQFIINKNGLKIITVKLIV